MIERLRERLPTNLAIRTIGLPVTPDVGGFPALPEFQRIEVRRADRRQDIREGSVGAGPNVDQCSVDVERENLHQRGRRGASAQTRSTSSIVLGTPTVSTSRPDAVIRTSSSILTPMPRNSRGIGWTIFSAFAFSSSSSRRAAAAPSSWRREYISSSLYSRRENVAD